MPGLSFAVVVLLEAIDNLSISFIKEEYLSTNASRLQMGESLKLVQLQPTASS